jgi:acyl-ACP thioesterase
MEQKISILEHEFHVNSFEVDLLKQLTVQNICKYFQEAAWEHAESLGVGFSDLVPKGKLWVLSRIAISISKLPQWGETIKIRTWPCGFQSVFAQREFEILDSKGQVVISGSSAWIIIDKNSRRPQRVEQFTSGIPEVSNKNRFGIETLKICELKEKDQSMIVKSVYSDLDMNGHVNNSRYIGWVIDTYSKEFHQTHQLRKLYVNFLSETDIEEQLEVQTKKIEVQTYLHSIIRMRDNVETCRIQMFWE